MSQKQATPIFEEARDLHSRATVRIILSTTFRELHGVTRIAELRPGLPAGAQRWLVDVLLSADELTLAPALLVSR